MALHHSPAIVTDGLILYYDMNNTPKSWKGAPTTNRVVSVPYVVNAYAYCTGPVAQTAPGPDGSMVSVQRFTVTHESQAARGRTNITGLSTGIDYVYSCKIKFNHSRVPTWNFDVSKGNPEGSNNTFTTNQTITTPLGNGWHNLELRFNLSACPTNGAFGTFGPISIVGDIGRTYDIYDIQFEQAAYQTPIVTQGNGIRSSTQAICDLTAVNTLTATNLVYPSDGTFALSETAGSTIVSNVPVTAIPALSGWTLECVAKITAFPTGGATAKKGVLLGATSYSGAAIYWVGNTAGTVFSVYGFVRGADAYRTTANSALSLNTWYHLAVVHDPVAVKLRLYINGILVSEVAGATQEYHATNILGAGNLGVNKAQVDGGGTDTYSYTSSVVPNAKVYSRALSDIEVFQNFTALRGRYGL